MSTNKYYFRLEIHISKFINRGGFQIQSYLRTHMRRVNITKLSHTFLVISFRRANWWVILYSIYNLFIFMFLILRFKPACYKHQGIVPVLYWPAPRLSTERERECASVFEFRLCLLDWLSVCLSANILISLHILLCSPLLRNSKKFAVMNHK